jgi:hypothetical protein
MPCSLSGCCPCADRDGWDSRVALRLFVERPLLARFGVVVLVFRDDPPPELEPLPRRVVWLVKRPLLARLPVLALVVVPDEPPREVFPDDPLRELEVFPDEPVREPELLVRGFALLVESAIPHLS